MDTVTGPSDTPEADPGSKSEFAYQSIRNRIADGIYGPGHRLVLDRLAREIGVSAVPVREALRRLEAEGYVDFQRNLGATVRTLDAAAYGETAETLAILEATATALAAPHLGKEGMKAARRLNEAMARSLIELDPVEFSNLDQEFHEVLYLPCPNAYLVGMVERESSRLRGIRNASFAFIPKRSEQMIVEHTELLDLIEAGGTAGRIEDQAREHRMATVRYILDRAGASSGVRSR